MSNYYLNSICNLREYCEIQGYSGVDPYDGLNSKVFQLVPMIRESEFARFIWIQFFKRNPINLRSLFLVGNGVNPKAIALFISGYCCLFRHQNLASKNQPESRQDLLQIIQTLTERLISLRSSTCKHTSAWGYNFDWQARRLFLFPKGTPTVVVTSYCTSALFDAYEITGRDEFLTVALSSADFVLNDLHRTPKEKGFLFSYSPLNGNNTVYNASLLGTKLLSQCYYYTKNDSYLAAARESAVACTAAQNNDGSWFYGELPVQQWIDSFHTGYNLEALSTYQLMTGDTSFSESIKKGFDFYLGNFFMPDGVPKYYHNKTYPVDIHSPAQLIVTLCSSGKLEEQRDLADRVLNWTIRNMQDPSGYFYYQKHRLYTNKISYMRWSNAFMFNALSLYLLHSSDK